MQRASLSNATRRTHQRFKFKNLHHSQCAMSSAFLEHTHALTPHIQARMCMVHALPPLQHPELCSCTATGLLACTKADPLRNHSTVAYEMPAQGREACKAFMRNDCNYLFSPVATGGSLPKPRKCTADDPTARSFGRRRGGDYICAEMARVAHSCNGMRVFNVVK